MNFYPDKENFSGLSIFTKKIIMIEICANSFQSAINAKKGGACRIELCSALLEGGLTPGPATILMAREIPDFKVHVLIRPRGGDFLYTSTETDLIRKDIEFCRNAGCDGVVFGFLTPKGEIDTALTCEMVELAAPMEVTFHRAFDMCRDPLTALEMLKETGIKRILTSGQAATASDGIPLIRELVRRAGNEIVIMPGAGINATNILEIARQTGATEFHLSATTTRESNMKYRNQKVRMGGNQNIPEYAFTESDTEKIREIVQLIDRLR